MRLNKKKDMKYPTMDSLNSIVNVLNETANALGNDDKVSLRNVISEVGVGSGSLITMTIISYKLLGSLGIKGYSAAGITSALKKAGSLLRKGMVAGIFVLTLPIAFVSIIAVIITGHYNRKNVRHVKERLYREAVKKLEAITKALKDEVDSDKERLDYLQSLKILLQRAVNDLKHDLGFE